jgi:hypothetical protein
LELKGRTLYSKRKKQCSLANVTYFRVKGTQGSGGIPLPLKAYEFISAE